MSSRPDRPTRASGTTRPGGPRRPGVPSEAGAAPGRPGRSRSLRLGDGGELGYGVPGALDAFPLDAMDRAAGAPAVPGNRIGLQFEGASTFASWLDAIGSARRYIHFENYILRDDPVGRTFRDALIEKACEGVAVHLLYDWIGSWATPRRYWKPLREAGVEVRAFNRPGVRDPFGVFQRDHRKLVCVDGEVAFVGGFCIGQEWAGSGSEPPWRDTGVEMRGPAAAVSARAFERIWNEIGDPIPDAFLTDPAEAQAEGGTPVWVIEGEPGRSRVYRALHVVASHVRDRLWITDPYFVAPRPVSEALAAAASSGVDVRILVPARNNWPWVGSLSRGGYRFLLEAGVRLFEWQGPMIHAKTSVADGVWGRVGSSNLNLASLLGNWEIDVGVLDEGFAAQLEGLFLADLASSVEIVLPRAMVQALEQEPTAPPSPVELARGEPPKASIEPAGPLGERLEREIRAQREQWFGRGGGSMSGSRLADLVRVGSALGDAIAGHRQLGREDRTVLGTTAGALLVLAGLAAFFPSFFGWAFAVLVGWFAIVLSARAFMQARRARREESKARQALERQRRRERERRRVPGGSEGDPSDGHDHHRGDVG